MRITASRPRFAGQFVRIGILVATFFLLCDRATAAAAEKQYNIRTGDATVTLAQFAAQSGEQLVYLVDNVRGEKTNAVAGRFTARRALEQMLQGTALAVTQDDTSGALVVGRKSPHSLYSPELATYGKGDLFQHDASVGFIQLYGLPLRTQAQLQFAGRTPEQMMRAVAQPELEPPAGGS